MKKGLFIGALVGGLFLGATFGCLAIFHGEEGMACVPLFFLSAWLVFLDVDPPKEWGLIGVILFWSFNIVLYSIIGGIIGWFLRKKGDPMKRVMVLVVGLLLAGFSNTFAAECADYAKGLEKCEKYSCKFTHPFTNTKMEKKILGLVDGKCGTTEEMPNHGMMACHYSEVQRKAVAQYLVKAMTAESVGMKTTIDTATGKAETRHTLDDKAVENPLDKAMNDGTCVISGY